MASFVCHLGWAKGVQITGKALFLAVSVSMLLEEINICFSRLPDKIHPHQERWASSDPLEARRNKKSEERPILALSSGARISISCSSELLNYIIVFPSSPAHRWQLWISWPSIINLLYLSFHILLILLL